MRIQYYQKYVDIARYAFSLLHPPPPTPTADCGGGSSLGDVADLQRRISIISIADTIVPTTEELATCVSRAEQWTLNKSPPLDALKSSVPYIPFQALSRGAAGFQEAEMGEVKFPEISTPILEKVCEYCYYKLRFGNACVPTPYTLSLISTSMLEKCACTATTSSATAMRGSLHPIPSP